LTMVAEGIEQVTQLDRVRRLGCHLGQGFLFSRPVDARCLESLLDDEAAGRSTWSRHLPAVSEGGGMAISDGSAGLDERPLARTRR